MSRKFLPAGALAVVALVLVTTLAKAGPGSASDPDDSSGIDISAIAHDNDAVDITYTLDTFAPFDNQTQFFTMEWELDLNNNGVTQDPDDACILVEENGAGGLTATLSDCFSNAAATANVTKSTQGSGERIRFAFAVADLGLAADAQYQYRVISQDFQGAEDTAPDTGFLAHSLTGSAATPTPTATPTPSASATPTATPARSATPTPTATSSPARSASPTPCPTARPTSTPSPTPSSSPSTTPTATPTSTPTSSPTATPTSTACPPSGLTSAATTGSPLSSTGSGTGTGVASASGVLPRTGASILAILFVAGVLVLAGFELFVRKERLADRASGDERSTGSTGALTR